MSRSSAAPTAVGRLQHLVRALIGFAVRPLTLSQALSSASGALGVVLGAAFLPRSAFADFVLLNLVANVMSGFGLAAVFIPALMQQRTDASSFVRPVSVAGLAVPTSLVTLTACVALGFSPVESVVVAVCIVLQPVYDWLRYRAIGLEQRWLVVGADALRLVTVLATPLMAYLHPDAVGLQAYLLLGLLLPIAALAVRGRRPAATSPYRKYAASSRWQVGDYVTGQFVVIIPMLVIGSGGAAAEIAGIRVAQSLLGPLNLLTAASFTNLVADASTRPSLASVDALIRSGSRAGWALAAAAVGGVGVMVTGVLATGVELRGVDNRSLVFGLAVVGAYSILSAWSVMQSAVVRLLGHQGLVTAGRLVVAGLAVAGFGLGYLLGGPRASAAAGYLVAGVMTLAVFSLMTRVVYRRERRAAST